MIIFYFLFFIFYLLLAICRLKWALFLICILLPTYQIRFTIFGLPTTLLEIMILILFVCWLIKSKVKNLRFRIQNWGCLILAWLTVSLIAVFVSPDKWSALGHWRAYFLEPVLVLIVVLGIIRQPDNQKTRQPILFGLALSALYCSVWAICQKIFHFGGVMSLEVWRYPLTPVWRATGPFSQPNFLGLYLEPIIILTIGQLISNFKIQIPKPRKLLVISFLLFVIITSLLAVILARSEGAILGIAVGLIFFGLLNSKSRKWVLTSLIILVIIVVVTPNLRSYFIQKITFHDFSSQIRLKIWSETLEMLKSRPIFGAGLRGHQTVIEKYHSPYLSEKIKIPIEIEPYPHNLFLTIWSELGILGLIIFFWILIKFFVDGFKRVRLEIRNSKLEIAIMASMVAIIVHGFIDTPYFKNDLAILFWLIVGLWISFNRDK